ncbi:leucine-rich repeat domain-containing protein [Candidatus Protochlamydia phocaeensis]|uniref:leucine-rich repeat domain-containing protein n=1 Tax=Candidatus Protochlamydia phocaeensis TaxID=1414722 RepID=UPI0018965517|nr:leucine-rich repeat domain-containing protein [Candidatus Protochlamydia phocaeensis]
MNTNFLSFRQLPPLSNFLPLSPQQSARKRPYAEFSKQDELVPEISARLLLSNPQETHRPAKRICLPISFNQIKDVFHFILAFSGTSQETILRLSKQDGHPLNQAAFYQIFEELEKRQDQSTLLSAFIQQARESYPDRVNGNKIALDWAARVNFIVQRIAAEAKKIGGGLEKLKETRVKYDHCIYAPDRLLVMCEWIETRKNQDLVTFFKAIPLADREEYLNCLVSLDPVPLTQQADQIRKWMEKHSHLLNQIPLLVLFKCGLTSLPPEIRLFTHLVELEISENHLASLPSEIGKLTFLRRFYAADNQLGSLPPEIRGLTLLQECDVSNNQLMRLPAEMAGLACLEELNIYGNQLTSLPFEIGRLTLLKQLYASDNQLKAIPSEIGGLAHLEELDIANNLITRLPSEISQLALLRTLNVSHNPLENLPSTITQLLRLEELHVSHTKLTSLSEEISKMKTLQKIYLSNGPALSSLPLILFLKVLV